MEKFGERRFENKNYYIGEFKNGRYHGRGVLLYPAEKKWVIGDFRDG